MSFSQLLLPVSIAGLLLAGAYLVVILFWWARSRIRIRQIEGLLQFGINQYGSMGRFLDRDGPELIRLRKKARKVRFNDMRKSPLVSELFHKHADVLFRRSLRNSRG